MISFRSVSECPLEQVVQLWHEAFADYYVKFSLNTEQFLARMAKEDLSPEHSLVAFVDAEPAGFLFNGFRQINGKTVAWNGGTAVVPRFRRSGVGRALMAETMKRYESLGVERATLEVFCQNERAQALYREFGYRITDRLVSYRLDGALRPVDLPELPEVTFCEHIVPKAVSALPFYDQQVPWQLQWQSVKDGEALLLKDSRKQTIGYALFKRTTAETGEGKEIVLYQCEIDSKADHPEVYLELLLRKAFADPNAQKVVFNLPAKKKLCKAILEKNGFQVVFEQYQMVKEW
jgi:ribosomal protein S18 acetylase RimI-like enzyme